MPHTSKKQKLCFGIFVKNDFDQVICFIPLAVNAPTIGLLGHQSIAYIERRPQQVTENRFIAIESRLAK
jgi:hypothetical protein